MRTPFVLNTDTKTRHALQHHIQNGGMLQVYTQGGTGFFSNLYQGFKRIAMPVMKSVAKAALPMASQALSAGLSAQGNVKQRLKAASQSALTKKNLTTLAKAGYRAARPIL